MSIAKLATALMTLALGCGRDGPTEQPAALGEPLDAQRGGEGGSAMAVGGDSSGGEASEPVGSGGTDRGWPPCSTAGEEIIHLINRVRSRNGKKAVAVDRSLCAVADAHVEDLLQNHPEVEPGCSLNSWSDEGTAPGCCYFEDHSAPSCMWNKPKEIVGFKGLGYESVAAHASDGAAAVDLWAMDPGHLDLIAERGIWEESEWEGIGAAFEGGIASLWFGDVDPAP